MHIKNQNKKKRKPIETDPRTVYTINLAMMIVTLLLPAVLYAAYAVVVDRGMIRCTIADDGVGPSLLWSVLVCFLCTIATTIISRT